MPEFQSMVLTRAVAAAFVLLAFQGCATSAERVPAASAELNAHQGHYIYGHEVNSFQPCGRTAEFWVVGADKLLEELKAQYRQLTSKRYEEVYVEFNGTVEGKADDGFATDYDGLIHIEDLILIRRKSKDDCE